MGNQFQVQHRGMLSVSLCLALFGLFFYANIREGVHYFDTIPAFSLLRWDLNLAFPEAMMEWFPSLLFILGVTLFTAAFVGINKKSALLIPFGWGLIASLLELAQISTAANALNGGHFEWVDMAAIWAGALISWGYFNSKTKSTQSFGKLNLKALLLFSLVGGGLMAMGSTPYYCEYPDGEKQSCGVKPIYLKWVLIRHGDGVVFNTESDNQLVQDEIALGAETLSSYQVNNFGKIYLYNDLLFVVDVLKGVHVFDNADPKSPDYLAFIRLSGATDVEVVNQIAYINSFTDMVAVSLADGFTLTRTQNVLGYPDPEPWLPPDVYFRQEQGDRFNKDKGVVIGYERDDDERFYFYDVEL